VYLQLSFFMLQSTGLLSVFNSNLLPWNSSMPRRFTSTSPTSHHFIHFAVDLGSFHEVTYLHISSAVWKLMIQIEGEFALWRPHCRSAPSLWKVLDYAPWQPPLRVVEGAQFSRIFIVLIPPREVPLAGKRVKRPISSFSCRDYLSGNDAPFFFTCFDNLVLLWARFAYLRHRCFKFFVP
jgi:hypothetical protein